jgi:hypothetical protein
MGNPIYLHYDSHRYSIAGRSLEDVQREIDELLAAGSPQWFEVNYGEGRRSRALILIAPGVSISIQQDQPEP